LKRLKEANKKEKWIWIIFISIIFLITTIFLYRSYAIYQNVQELNLIKGNVPNYMANYDAKITLMIDGVEANSFPSRDSGKVFQSATCDRGAKGVWDYEHWAPLVLNATEARTKCKYQFVSQYSESILNGTDPVLSEGLIPVIIDENGIVKKASLESEWYRYENQVWANAVLLEDEKVIYQNNEVIPEENIESYFVWIPRYKYKIFNEGNYEEVTSIEKREQAIEIEFENKDQAVSQGSRVGEWLTHPAFTSFNTNGMWVGKFETGYKGATKREEAEINGGFSSKVIIKPNVYSWRGISVSDAFIASYDYQRSMDSHLIKNTEWGAAAYLSHSEYGSLSKVRVNNNSSYLTGYAAVNEPTCGNTGVNEECHIFESTAPGVDGTHTINYKNRQSVVGSTTRNYSGVYDMSGGVWEYVMGVMVDRSGNPVSGRSDQYNSGFIGTLTYPNDGINKTKTTWTVSDGGIPFPEEKYFDKYAYADDYYHYNRRILGDGTGEMGPIGKITSGSPLSSWHSNTIWFVEALWPWFIRGADFPHGVEAGVFASERNSGFMYGYIGFRIVLMI